MRGNLLLKRIVSSKKLLTVSVALLILSITLAMASIYSVQTGQTQTVVLFDETFHLSSMETRRQGLGSFHGGENLTIQVQSNPGLMNFSIITYRATNFTEQSIGDITFSFIAGADYYETVFYCLPQTSGDVHLTVTVNKPAVEYPCSMLNSPAKVLFVASISVIFLITLKAAVNQTTKTLLPTVLPSISRNGHKRLITLLFISLIVWFSLLATNSNPLSDFEDWYTDHARHPYTSTLFLTRNFAVFNTPLGDLSSSDNSYYKFTTWPEMPHLYPMGSIFLFMPFALMLQNGADPTLVFKLEIVLFLVVAHICLYFFLKYFWKKPLDLPWKLIGVYIIYVSLVIFAANGMFDSVAFLFSLFGLILFLTKRYDYFILMVGVSIIFKYQAGIFLLPLIICALVELYRTNKFFGLIQNRPVLVGAALAVASGVTAVLSAPYLMQVRPELIMNGINAFNPHSQVSWWLQILAVALTLAVTLVYTAYIYKQNSLMALSAIFLLLPSFMMPYIQNWYLPFLFVYILIPQEKKVLGATMIWLVFMVIMLSFGGASFNPFLIIENIKIMLHL
ncbi:MAG: hypothetical protein FWG55_10560 [Candidatus Bathyarchaeota archaeon]|nr:hypothetical protein [Candidatus Termiticorpusculum sp.]